MTDESAPSWKLYERIVASLQVEAADMESSVTPNAQLVGSISGARRQIDVLIDSRWEGDIERRVIFDAKRRSRKVDVKDVEEFEGLMRDVNAARGVLVCTKGYTKAAKRRSEERIDIQILNENEAAEFDYSAVDPCPHCADKGRKPQGVVFWDGQFPIATSGWAIVFTGKCDVCRSFAFWCWDCGEKVVVPDDQEHVCGCERRWFVEKCEDEVLFVVAFDDDELPIDRRPVR